MIFFEYIDVSKSKLKRVISFKTFVNYYINHNFNKFIINRAMGMSVIDESRYSVIVLIIYCIVIFSKCFIS